MQCLAAPCGVQFLGGGDEALATDVAEFRVFSEISPRASLRGASSVNRAFLAEVAEHELERLSRCPPVLSRDERGGRDASGDPNEDAAPPLFIPGSQRMLDLATKRAERAKLALDGRCQRSPPSPPTRNGRLPTGRLARGTVLFTGRSTIHRSLRERSS